MVVYWLRHRGTAYPVHRGDCILGRAPHCFLVLSTEQVSREHAAVRLVGDTLEIEDLQSRNGTRVNGRAVEGKRKLEPGDVIEVGGERLEVLRRVSRDQAPTVQGDAPEDPAAKAQRNILELIEELAARAAESKDREALVKTIRGLVDTLVQSTERSGRRLSRGEAVRLVSVAKMISVWSQDAADKDWCTHVSRSVGQ
ncbi:MAG TPA: FHA domain-containing protein [Polyangiaceae bacterium]|nr:FHA domain-containing protein [Polyangiaceae bacterium]